MYADVLGGVTTVGLSRQHTAEQHPRTGGPTTKQEAGVNGLVLSKTATRTDGMGGEELGEQETVRAGEGFTADELAVAMSRSTIKAGQS